MRVVNFDHLSLVVFSVQSNHAQPRSPLRVFRIMTLISYVGP